MDVFLLEADWNDQYANPEDYAAQHECMNGDEFVLVRAAVSVATTYRMVGGKPQPVALAFADTLKPLND